MDTELPFGKEGFTSYMGKTFDPSLKLTRRYYPHTYNVDGFYVAKFKKIGPTPSNVNRGGATDEPVTFVDKTPIVESADAGGDNDDGDFGGFDEAEDKGYMERAKRSAMRRRGLDPRSLDRARGSNKSG